MARLDLHFADELFCYQTHLTVRITDINAANHLANDSMISMISEARARFLFEMGVEETREDGIGKRTPFGAAHLKAFECPPPGRVRRVKRGGAKIPQQGIPLSIMQNIVRIQIAMQDTAPMQVGCHRRDF